MNGKTRMGSAGWIKDTQQFPTGPSTLAELYSCHFNKSTTLADPTRPGSLANAIDVLAHGLEKYSDFSGIRFDDAATTMLEECLAEHLEPHRNNWSKGSFAVHTASCDLNLQCVKVL